VNQFQEKRLIKKCIQQDRLAQRVLYEQYKTAMYSKAYRITNNQDLAHDALQEGFIKVFKHIESYKGSGSLAGWIKTIVVRAALQQLKGLHLYLELDDKLVGESEPFDDDLTGELLDKLMSELPEKCRIVFTLIEVEGYSHKEVAEELGVAVGTSKSQLNYAKQLLKTQLKNRGYEQFKKG
tara:strand:+ start:87 stop:629 length:543 start_codon:yes stop_codon:yes gene_type:complete